MFRAFFAIRQQLTTSRGLPTKAVFVKANGGEVWTATSIAEFQDEAKKCPNLQASAANVTGGQQARLSQPDQLQPDGMPNGNQLSTASIARIWPPETLNSSPISGLTGSWAVGSRSNHPSPGSSNPRFDPGASKSTIATLA